MALTRSSDGVGWSTAALFHLQYHPGQQFRTFRRLWEQSKPLNSSSSFFCSYLHRIGGIHDELAERSDIYISIPIKSPMVFRQLFGAGSSRVRICGKKYARVRLLNFQKNIGFVCVRPNLPSQIGGSKMVQTMCNQGIRFSNFLSFGSYALRFFYNL